MNILWFVQGIGTGFAFVGLFCAWVDYRKRMNKDKQMERNYNDIL